MNKQKCSECKELLIHCACVDLRDEYEEACGDIAAEEEALADGMNQFDRQERLRGK